MTIEEKMRHTVLQMAVKRIFADGLKDPERSARNLVEMVEKKIGDNQEQKELLENLYKETLRLLKVEDKEGLYNLLEQFISKQKKN